MAAERNENLMKTLNVVVLSLLCAVGARAAAAVPQIVAWGDNSSGQTNVPVAAQSGVTAIAAGNSHTVALKTNGAVLAWGDNSYGQTNVSVAAQSDVIAIAAANSHTLALKRDGTVLVWGGSGAWAPPFGLSNVTAISRFAKCLSTYVQNRFPAIGCGFLQKSFGERGGTGPVPGR